MVGLIVHWELPAALLSSPAAQQKLLGWITLTCKTFAVDKLAIVDVDNTGIMVRDEEINAVVVNTLHEALAMFDNQIPVYVEHGGTYLDMMSEHPIDAVYIVGSDYGSLKVPEGALHVTIKTAQHFGLYSHVAAAIVLHHRSMIMSDS